MDAHEIEEALDELEVKMKRLKIEYDQYFLGAMKREPAVLKGEIQKIIQRFLSTPLTNSRYRFRFNALVARYQCFRQLWGRTLREIEAGTYRGQKFRKQLEAREERAEPTRQKHLRSRDGLADTEVRKLYDALASAREKSGEGMSGLTPEKLGKIVSKTISDLRRRNPSGKIKFRIVRDGKRTQLKATVVKP